MTVSELIVKLSKLPGELPVYVADWNEEYAGDTELLSASIEEACSGPGGSLPRRLTLEGNGQNVFA